MEFVLRLWLGMRSWIYFIKERYLPFYELLWYCYKTKNAIKHKFYSVLPVQRRKRDSNFIGQNLILSLFLRIRTNVATNVHGNSFFTKKATKTVAFFVLRKRRDSNLAAVSYLKLVFYWIYKCAPRKAPSPINSTIFLFYILKGFCDETTWNKRTSKLCL